MKTWLDTGGALVHAGVAVVEVLLPGGAEGRAHVAERNGEGEESKNCKRALTITCVPASQLFVSCLVESPAQTRADARTHALHANEEAVIRVALTSLFLRRFSSNLEQGAKRSSVQKNLHSLQSSSSRIQESFSGVKFPGFVLCVRPLMRRPVLFRALVLEPSMTIVDSLRGPAKFFSQPNPFFFP